MPKKQARPTTKPNIQSPPEIARHRETPTDEDIRARAYEMYLERGGQDGMDFDDWVRAERELRKT